MALKLMSYFFTKHELTNGTPLGTTTSKDERRVKTVQKLNPSIMQYIEGINDIVDSCANNYIILIITEKLESKWPGSYKSVHRQMSQKCVDAYGNNPTLRL